MELWNAASDGDLVVDEPDAGPDALAVDTDGNISFLFSSLQVPPGLLKGLLPWQVVLVPQYIATTAKTELRT